MAKAPGKKRRKNADALLGYARTESFNRISGYTLRDPRPRILRGRVVTVILFGAMVLTGLYFVIY
jgi:hypothetical protein